MLKLKIKLYPVLENIFEVIEERAGYMREYFAICEDCGANRYTGKPCVKFEDNDVDAYSNYTRHPKTPRQFISEE